MSMHHTMQAINQFWRYAMADPSAIPLEDRAEVNEANLLVVLNEGNLRERLARLMGEGVAPTTAQARGQGG